MPPKKAGAKSKGKGKGKGKKKAQPPPLPEPEPEPSYDSLLDKELDLLNDLNDDFFAAANKVIQNLMEANKNFEASKIKRYVDIIHNLHRKYVDEVNENESLRPQIVRAEAKLRFALELTATSEAAMDKLKDSLGDAWRAADVSMLREQDTQEKMQEIILKCEQFESKEAEKQDDSAEFGHLAKYKGIILRERDRLNGEVMDLEKRLQLQRYYAESLEYINKNHEENIAKMTTKIKVLDSEKINLNVKLRTLQSNLDDQKETNVKNIARMDIVARELNDTQIRLQRRLQDVDKQKLVIDKLRGDATINTRQLLKYEDDIDSLRKEAKENEETIRTLRLEDKSKGNSILQLTKKYKKIVQENSMLSSKLYKMNRTSHLLNEEILRLKNQINAFEKDILSASYKYEDLRRFKENIQRERDNLRSDIIKLNDTIADSRHTIIIQSNNIDSLRMDVNKLNVKLDEAKINISKAEKERDEMTQEVETLQERIETYQEQIQLKTDQVADLTEKLHMKNMALINVKKQLETVHSEKMVLQRSLETCTQERDNFRILQAKTSHQISQLTTEISQNQHKINSLNMKIERLNNDKKDLQSDLKNTENLLASVRKDLKDSKMKNESLSKTIADDEFKFMKNAQELEETRKEKNLIGLQIVRRNDEIMLLKEKLVIMQTALDKGQTQYNQRVEDIRLLKMEISNLQTERECLTRAIKSTADMREEIVRLQRSLNQERIKVRTLTEDAKTPTGVHRWRILKGEDPNKFELLAKVQMLQRRNLQQEIAKSNLQAKLVEAQKVYLNLKRFVEVLPTPEVKHRLAETQRLNRRQVVKMKALSAELAIDEIELQARECIIEEFKNTLKIAKQSSQVKPCAPSPSSISHEVMAYVASASDHYVDTVFVSSEKTSAATDVFNQDKSGITI